jgi:hypothetical protein
LRQESPNLAKERGGATHWDTLEVRLHKELALFDEPLEPGGKKNLTSSNSYNDNRPHKNNN